MDRQMFESIMKATKATKGAEIYEALTGNTPASIKIAKDWLSALRDVIANKVDVVKVIKDFEAKINAEVAKGDYSNVYSHIRQQMPDLMDLGAVAANLESMEKWLKQATPQSVNEISDAALAKKEREGTLTPEEREKRVKALQAHSNSLPNNAKGKDGKYLYRTNEESVDEVKGTGASLTTATQSPSKVNAGVDLQDIKKTPVQRTDPGALDAANSNKKGTVGDEIVEGYYVDDDGDIFYVHENGNAFYVDEEGEPVEEAFFGNVFESEIVGEKLEISEDEEDDNTIEPNVLFEDADGDMVYFNEDGDLLYATDEEIAYVMGEDINIHYNSEGPGGVNGGGVPPQEDPNAQAQAIADTQPPQEPMQVELINNGQSGEVNGVVVDVAGKHIEIGPDGTVNEQPAGGGMPPQQPPQGQAVQESLATVSANLMKFFGEDNHDYTDVKHRTPKTATGGTFPDNGYRIDPKAVDALNSGGDIDGHKDIKEEVEYVIPGQLFEEAGKWYYYDEDEKLFEATEQEVQDAKNASPKNHDDITIPMGLGKSITSVNEDKPVEESETGGIIKENLSDYGMFARAIRGAPEAWRPSKAICD